MFIKRGDDDPKTKILSIVDPNDLDENTKKTAKKVIEKQKSVDIKEDIKTESN